MAERRLVIATGNAGKLGEYRSLLAGVGWKLMAVDPDVAEVGSTYAENATLKAEAARAALELPAVGDDSGVEVDVLKGYPGVHSARIGPTQKERTQVLLDRLASHPRPWLARFTCTIALAAPGRPTSFFEGECRGEIIPEWRGATEPGRSGRCSRRARSSNCLFEYSPLPIGERVRERGVIRPLRGR